MQMAKIFDEGMETKSHPCSESPGIYGEIPGRGKASPKIDVREKVFEHLPSMHPSLYAQRISMLQVLSAVRSTVKNGWSGSPLIVARETSSMEVKYPEKVPLVKGVIPAKGSVTSLVKATPSSSLSSTKRLTLLAPSLGSAVYSSISFITDSLLGEEDEHEGSTVNVGSCLTTKADVEALSRRLDFLGAIVLKIKKKEQEKL